MKLKVSTRKAYGRTRYYAECDVTRLLLMAMMKKSFTPDDLRMFQDQGHAVEIIDEVKK